MMEGELSYQERKKRDGQVKGVFWQMLLLFLRKRKNGSNYLPGESWPSARKLVPGLKVSEMCTVITERKVVCG